MSRSYKKFPIVKYAPSSSKGDAVKKEKRFANKKVRRSYCIDGAYYKKLYNSYNIHDWIVELPKAYRK